MLPGIDDFHPNSPLTISLPEVFYANKHFLSVTQFYVTESIIAENFPRKFYRSLFRR